MPHTLPQQGRIVHRWELENACISTTGRRLLQANIIIGPVANDNVFRTIDMFEAGDLTESEAIERFKVNELFDQYLFCNEKALEALRFVRSYEVI